MPNLRAALEEALAVNPDDQATYAAYADLLMEQGDPRGEFIQVQLALENESLPAAQRRELTRREKQLLKHHERDWLGPLARYLLDNDTSHVDSGAYGREQWITHRWRRGFLNRIEAHYLDRRLAHAMLDAPGPWLLRELVIGEDAGFWGDLELNPPPSRVKRPRGVREQLALFELRGSGRLQNLRELQIGSETGGERGWSACHCYTPGLEHVVAELPRVEEMVLLTKGYSTKKLFGLRNLTHLRILHVEHMEDYPLHILAKNPALGNLTQLWLHPHYWDEFEGDDDDDEDAALHGGYLPLKSLAAVVRSPHLKKLTHLRFRLSSAGDDGVRLLIDHGWLRQLKVLDLRHGRITDEGARLLADNPDLKYLTLLDLSRNQLTPAGIARLRATGINLRCDDQHPVGSTEYLTEGDFE